MRQLYSQPLEGSDLGVLVVSGRTSTRDALVFNLAHHNEDWQRCWPVTRKTPYCAEQLGCRGPVMESHSDEITMPAHLLPKTPENRAGEMQKWASPARRRLG